MNDAKKTKNEKVVRVSKSEKPKIKGETNWAALIAAEKKDGYRK